MHLLQAGSEDRGATTYTASGVILIFGYTCGLVKGQGRILGPLRAASVYF